MTDSPSSRPPPCETHVTALGAEGDGLAMAPDGARLFLPLTLPGETVRATPIAPRGGGWVAAAEVMLPSPDRVAPPCAHFGACGGCAVQHMADPAYAAWKAGLLADALGRAGYGEATLGPLARTPARARRRMDFAIRRQGGAVMLGLHAPRGAAVVDLRECHVLHPALAALLAPLRGLLARLEGLRREGSAIVNLLESGPDLLLRTDAPLSVGDRARLAAFAAEHGLPRVAHARGTQPPEPAATLRPAVTRFGPAEAAPPPGAFLQALSLIHI